MVAVLCSWLCVAGGGVGPGAGEGPPVSCLWLDDLGEADAAEAVAFAQEGGFGQVLLGYTAWSRGTPDGAWHPVRFPHGAEGLRTVIDTLHAAGLPVGLHVLEPPLPAQVDPALRAGPTATLSAPLNRVMYRVFTEKPPEGFPLPSAGYALQIGQELLVYGTVAADPPGFLGCGRGAYLTAPADHAGGETVWLVKLPTDRSPFIPAEAAGDRLEATARRIGEVCAAAGGDFVYLDRTPNADLPADALRAAFHRSVAEKIAPARLTAPGNPISNFQFPVSNLQSPISDYSDVDAWGMRALAYGTGLTLRTSLADLRRHPQTTDLLRSLRHYDEARRSQVFSEEQRAAWRGRAGGLMLVREGETWAVREARPLPDLSAGPDLQARWITPSGAAEARIAYWHRRKDGRLILPLAADEMRVRTASGKEEPVPQRGNQFVLPVGTRRFLEVRGAEESAIAEAFRAATVRTGRTVWVPAEQVQKVVGQMALGSAVGLKDDGAFGDFLVPTAASSPEEKQEWYAEYTVTLPHAGPWYVWGRVKYASTYANSFSFALDGEPNTGATFGNDMNFGPWHWDGGVRYTLPAGPLTFRLYEREGTDDPATNPCLDVICFTDEADYVPADEEAAGEMGQ
jgi:hypothetical protein